RGAAPLGPPGSQQQLDAGAAVPGQGGAGNATTAGRQTAGPAASSASDAAGRAAAGPAAHNGAYDQGVTDTSIKVGFLLYDLGGASQAGFTQTGLDPKPQRAAFEAYVDEGNRAGGINGRKIDAVYATYDLVSED